MSYGERTCIHFGEQKRPCNPWNPYAMTSGKSEILPDICEKGLCEHYQSTNLANVPDTLNIRDKRKTQSVLPGGVDPQDYSTL